MYYIKINKMKGIRIDEDGDVMVRPHKDSKEKIDNGLIVGNVDMDIAERIICAWQGEFKEAPLLGGNIDNFRNGIYDPFFQGHVHEQLTSEGINISRVEITENGVEIELED